MFEAAAGYVGELLVQASVADETAERRGNRHPTMAPHGVFPCLGQDEWLAPAVRDDRDWQALLSAAGDATELSDQRFVTAAGRLAAVEELEASVARWTSTHGVRELMQALQSVGVPAAPGLRTDEVFADPQFVARGWFLPMAHPDMGTHLYNGHPWRFSRSPLVCRNPSPRLGEHSADVLMRDLGLDAAEYERLLAEGVTGLVARRPATAAPTR